MSPTRTKTSSIRRRQLDNDMTGLKASDRLCTSHCENLKVQSSSFKVTAHSALGFNALLHYQLFAERDYND